PSTRTSTKPTAPPCEIHVHPRGLHVFDAPYAVASPDQIDHERLLARCCVLQDRELRSVFANGAVDYGAQLGCDARQDPSKRIEDDAISRLCICGEVAQRSGRIIDSQPID